MRLPNSARVSLRVSRKSPFTSTRRGSLESTRENVLSPRIMERTRSQAIWSMAARVRHFSMARRAFSIDSGRGSSRSASVEKMADVISLLSASRS
jgi:hypothetical protein